MPENTPRLNLVKPDTGNQSWEIDVERWAQKLDECAAQYLVISLGGEAVDEEIFFNDFLFDEAVTITGASLFARTAPTGGAFTVDFLKNDVEQGKTVSINIGQSSGSGSIAGLTYDPSSPTPEKLGLKVKNIGATLPGAEISVVVHYHVQPVP
ncbi:MAG: hypothetical protein KC553_04445 [Nitrospina sp.]|nr:hypothetical protein [Nitrospina sp.]